MGLSLRGATSGAIDINPPAVAGDNTITLPSNNGSANQFFKNSGTAGIVTYSSMVETSTGNLGLGTDSPTALSNFVSLTFDGTTGGNIEFKDDGVLRGSVYNLADQFIVQAQGSTTPLAFRTNSLERARLTSGGQLHVGNSTNNAIDNALFKAVADDGEAADIYVGQFINNEATAGESYGVNIQAGSNGTDHGLRVKNRANTSTQFLVRGDGNVGIGEDSPANRLVVQETNASGDVAVRVKNDTTTDGSAATPTTASLYLTTSTGDFNTFYMQARRNDNDTWFGYADPRTAGHVPTMCLTDDGKVGIGTDNPTSIFDVETGTGGGINFAPDGANVPTINFRAGSTKVEQAAQILVGENSGGGDFLIKTKDTGGTLTTRVTVGNAGDTTLNNGNLVIGTSGKGIDFSANTSGSGTATSNILDDYEEGTWTATFSGASTAGTYTVTTTACRYTKIGDTVNLVVDMKNITTVSAGSGLLRISGLPFNPSNGNEAGSVILEQFDFPTSVTYAVLRTSTSTNGLLLVGMKNGQSDIQFSVDDKASDIADIFGQITYKTAS